MGEVEGGIPYDPDKHHRRSVRLRGYDYALAGAYFVTNCTHARECLLGTVLDGRMILSKYGSAVQDCWNDLPRHYGHVVLDEMVIMPNHVHGIIILTPPDVATSSVGAGLPVLAGPGKPAPNTESALAQAKRHGLPEIVRALKTHSSRRINELRLTHSADVWQRNYHDRIIRNDRQLQAIRGYIRSNADHWAEDPESPNGAVRA